MTHRIWTRLVFAVVMASMLAIASPVLAQTFLIDPKPEKKWMQYFYRANGVAPAPKPSTLVDGGIGFQFLDTPDTALFMTGHPAYNGTLLGDLTGETVSASIDIAADGGTFIYYGQGTANNPCGTPANVRLYFSTNNNELGESQYWWSNPVSYPLADGAAELSAALTPDKWSDRDGHLGTYNAEHIAAFAAAVADVQHIGLSFGGGCFFANGVGYTGTAFFTLTDFSVVD